MNLTITGTVIVNALPDVQALNHPGVYNAAQYLTSKPMPAAARSHTYPVTDMEQPSSAMNLTSAMQRAMQFSPSR